MDFHELKSNIFTCFFNSGDSGIAFHFAMKMRFQISDSAGLSQFR